MWSVTCLPVVVTKVRVWHPQNLLDKGALEEMGWRGDRVAYKVVDPVAAHRAGEAHVEQLERRRPSREAVVARALGVPVEIDEDVDTIRGNLGGDRERVEVGDFICTESSWRVCDR